jgi:hypothetical protein
MMPALRGEAAMESLRDWVEDHWLKTLGVLVLLAVVAPEWLGGPVETVLGLILIGYLAVLAAILLWFGLRALFRRA